LPGRQALGLKTRRLCKGDDARTLILQNWNMRRQSVDNRRRPAKSNTDWKNAGLSAKKPAKMAGLCSARFEVMADTCRATPPCPAER
jgi:hypothetical protein